jgi:hypothetical protein
MEKRPTAKPANVAPTSARSRGNCVDMTGRPLARTGPPRPHHDSASTALAFDWLSVIAPRQVIAQ